MSKKSVYPLSMLITVPIWPVLQYIKVFRVTDHWLAMKICKEKGGRFSFDISSVHNTFRIKGIAAMPSLVTITHCHKKALTLIASDKEKSGASEVGLGEKFRPMPFQRQEYYYSLSEIWWQDARLFLGLPTKPRFTPCLGVSCI